jgi:KDO2-lipid IV(A) lauroyltransferase
LPVSARVLAEVVFSLIWLLGRVPAVARRGLAWAGAALWSGLRLREFKVARRNLALIEPDASPLERDARARAAVHGMALNFFDTLAIWSHPPAHNLARIRDRHGESLFLDALESGQGLIVAAPHYGNWELLNQYLASRCRIAIVYRPPDSKIGDALLLRLRRGAAVTQVRAEAGGVRALFRTLKAGGVAGILPDQQPKSGDGVFAPFFGKPALTMTLIQRLAQRTGARVLFAFCERRGDGDFDLHFSAADPAVADPDPERAARALNQGVEAIARRDFRQYQWTYKRYTLRPAGSGETNPYWPECYSRRAVRRHAESNGDSA